MKHSDLQETEMDENHTNNKIPMHSGLPKIPHYFILEVLRIKTSKFRMQRSKVICKKL